VPAGASTGQHEAVELRDGDPARYGGRGVLKAVAAVQGEIAEQVRGKEWEQRALDDFLIKLDGTANKSRLGANAILGVSLAFARAQALARQQELYQYIANLAGNREFRLPQPAFNIINGGRHADSGLDLQEFMIVPAGAHSLCEGVRVAAEVIAALRAGLAAKGYATSVGDEGGFAPKLSSNEEAFELIMAAIHQAGYSADAVKIAIDAAASEFYKDGNYTIRRNGAPATLSSGEMIDWYEQMATRYPLVSIEDGLAEDDWDGFALMQQRLGGQLMIVGDDLTVTNVTRINQAIARQAINAVLIKLNQIGTLTETLDAVALTKKQGWAPFISHRSGETTDTFIADLAVGLACPYIKAGSLARGERVCKYNRLMEIEDKLHTS
jgi:enolase